MDKALREHSKSVLKRKYGNLYELAELSKKDIALFAADMEEAIAAFKLVKVNYNETDIRMLWDDIKESTYYEEFKKESRDIDWDKDIIYWGDSDREESTKKYIKDNLNSLREKYPLYRTSRLVQWYSIYEKLTIPQKIYELTKQDYDYFFMLKGEKFDGDYQFYTIVNTLCKKQVVEKRKAVLKELLRDSKVIEQLRNSTFILPARAQFYLSTPQVYDAWLRSMMEKPKYKSKSTEVFRLVSKLMKEGYNFKTAIKLAETKTT